MRAKYLYNVRMIIIFFIENICFDRIKGVPLRHESKTLTTLFNYEA